MGETERAYAASEARAYAAVRQERDMLRQQLAEAKAGWAKAANDCREACMDRDHEYDRAERLECELAAARAAMGVTWIEDGATLAEGIRRKTAMLEGLITPDELPDEALTPADPTRPTVAVPRDLVESIVGDLREGLALEPETLDALAALLEATHG